MSDGFCNPHLDLVSFKFPLTYFAQSLRRGRRAKVVAIGSSSTAGEPSPSGDVKIVPYPHRLELALRTRYPGRMIDVLNRGLGGQEAPEELSRFESDVIAEDPALTIWQVGTNAIFHSTSYNPDAVAAAITTGLDWLKHLPMDVIVMDLQYTPILVQHEKGNPDPNKEKATEHMVSLIGAAACEAGVNLFPRYALMQQWCKSDGKTLADLVDPTDSSRLHMSEFATQCVTVALDKAIGTVVGPVPGGASPLS
jgi:acyl-CoA thioesterase-1